MKAPPDRLALSESAEKPRKSIWAKIKLVTAMFLLGVLVLVVFSVRVPHSGLSRFGKNFEAASSVATLCGNYATDHGGKFPPSLAALDPPLDLRYQYRDFDSSRPYDWLYFPGATFGDGAKRIILASPTASTRSEKDRRERIAVFADGHDAIWPESKFQQYLKQLSIELTSPGTRSK